MGLGGEGRSGNKYDHINEILRVNKTVILNTHLQCETKQTFVLGRLLVDNLSCVSGAGPRKSSLPKTLMGK